MTRIVDLLNAGRTFSFEFFPPKSAAELAALSGALRDLQTLSPSFVSVTYRGGAESRKRTYDLVTGMLHTTELVPMAHLICVAHSRLELAEILVALRRAGVENLMALGGDPPTDPEAGQGELNHAAELVELARAIGGFSIGVAAHPAGHPNSPDLEQDRRYLAAKLELADFGVTQFFFDVAQYESLMDQLSGLGVDKPVLPGLMPVTSLSSLPRMAVMGAPVPAALVARLEEANERGGPGDVRKAGIDASTEMCQHLLDLGAPGLHFYTLNRSSATREIYSALGLAPSLAESR